MGLKTRKLCGPFVLGAILIGQAGACSGRAEGERAHPDKLSCGADGDCASGERCQAGHCVVQAGGGGVAGRDAQADGATEDVGMDAPEDVGVDACVRAACGRGNETCCPGFECKSLALYNCARARQDVKFCREQMDWTGICYAKDDVPCGPDLIGLVCPNIPVFGPAPANATCCAPLDDKGHYSCVDPSSNPTYCAKDGATAIDAGPAGPPNDGTCGSGCTGGCAAGHCWFPLAANVFGLLSIAQDTTHVYFAMGGTINKVPLNGGAVSRLASWQDPIDLAVDGSHVYFVTYSGGTVARVPVAGGTPVVLASDQIIPTDIAIDATSVYWAIRGDDHTQASIMKVPLAGGQPQRLAVSEYEPIDLAVDGTNVYWAASGRVMRVPLAGGTPATLALTQGSPLAVALRGDTLYFTSYFGLASIDGVFAVARAGGNVSPLALDQSGPLGIAVDMTHVYWINSYGPQGLGMIAKAPLTGGAPTMLATHLDEPLEIVVDATSVYFTTRTAIMKLSPK
jgi:hypothetical protein